MRISEKRELVDGDDFVRVAEKFCEILSNGGSNARLLVDKTSISINTVIEVYYRTTQPSIVHTIYLAFDRYDKDGEFYKLYESIVNFEKKFNVGKVYDTHGGGASRTMSVNYVRGIAETIFRNNGINYGFFKFFTAYQSTTDEFLKRMKDWFAVLENNML